MVAEKKVNDYFSHMEMRGMSPMTIKTYGFYINKFLNDINKKPTSVTKEDIINYLVKNRKKFNPKSLSLIRSILIQMADYFDIDIKRKEFPTIKIPKYNPKIISKEDVLLMVKNCETDKERMLIKFLAGTGTRLSECNSIEVDDIDHFSVSVLGKGMKDRVIPISRELYNELMKYIKKNNIKKRIFPISARTIERVVTRVSVKSGLNGVHTHTLRHFFATNLMNQGVDIKFIQEILGHSKISTTEIYLHVSKENLRKAVDGKSLF